MDVHLCSAAQLHIFCAALHSTFNICPARLLKTFPPLKNSTYLILPLKIKCQGISSIKSSTVWRGENTLLVMICARHTVCVFACECVVFTEHSTSWHPTTSSHFLNLLETVQQSLWQHPCQMYGWRGLGVGGVSVGVKRRKPQNYATLKLFKIKTDYFIEFDLF